MTNELVKNTNCLTFYSNSNTNSTITWVTDGTSSPQFEYSYDMTNWNTWDYSALTFKGANDALYLRGKNYVENNGEKSYTIGSDSNNHFAITCSSHDVFCKGNLMHLIDYNETLEELPLLCKFSYLFLNCEGLLSCQMMTLGASALSTASTATNTYAYMFSGCTNLMFGPELPALNLTKYCYAFMFANCSSLRSAPVLEATTLNTYCYDNMFVKCTSLTHASSLNATTLKTSCYRGMFSGCTSLIQGADISVSSIEESACSGMYASCTSLTIAPSLSFNSVKANGCKLMFANTNLKVAPDFYCESIGNNCYNSMFSGCTQLQIAPLLPSTTTTQYCYDSMFYGCSNLWVAPEISASTLNNYCFSNTFRNCSNLKFAAVCYTTNSARYTPYTNMFIGCPSQGVLLRGTSGDDIRSDAGNTSWYLYQKQYLNMEDATFRWYYTYNNSTGIKPFIFDEAFGEVGDANSGTTATNTRQFTEIYFNNGGLLSYGETTLTKDMINESEKNQVTRIIVGDNVAHIHHDFAKDLPNLSEVVIGNHVFSIGNNAFSNCPSLVSIVLGKNLRVVGYSAFSQLNNLSTIYLLSPYLTHNNACLNNSFTRLQGSHMTLEHYCSANDAEYFYNYIRYGNGNSSLSIIDGNSSSE